MKAWKRLADLVSGRSQADTAVRLAALEGQLGDALALAANVERGLHEAEAKRAADVAAADMRTANSLMLEDSLRRLASRRAGLGLCIVSVLPPSATGIALCTLATYAHAPFPVDIFVTHDTIPEYLRCVDDPRLVGAASEAFGLASLPRGRARRDYAGEVFTFGNSPHHLPTYMALKARGASGPVFAHLHEPFLIDLAGAYAKEVKCAADKFLRVNYGARFDGLETALVNEDAAAFASSGVLGAKALFHDLNVTAFLVNSHAARDLLLRDWPELDPSRVHVLFHPVFAPLPVKRTPRATPRIGSFGIPSVNKHTPLLVEAFRILRARRPIELLLAGYHADYFARTYGYANELGIIIVDAPDDRALEQLMANVDLAIQLRAHNLGESSGAIAQLLAQTTPVLASRVGSFVEFGEAVSFAPESLDAATLADAIEREMGFDIVVRREAMRAYVELHSPKRFCQKLLEISHAR
jgi:glycosyltransferase involved in cell wall biosynthesis